MAQYSVPRYQRVWRSILFHGIKARVSLSDKSQPSEQTGPRTCISLFLYLSLVSLPQGPTINVWKRFFVSMSVRKQLFVSMAVSAPVPAWPSGDTGDVVDSGVETHEGNTDSSEGDTSEAGSDAAIQ